MRAGAAGGEAVDDGVDSRSGGGFMGFGPGFVGQVDEPIADDDADEAFFLKGRPQQPLLGRGCLRGERDQVTGSRGQLFQGLGG